MLTERQRALLHLVQRDLAADQHWMHRVLTTSNRALLPEERISWDEMDWLKDIETQALTVRIQAMLLVDSELDALNRPLTRS